MRRRGGSRRLVVMVAVIGAAIAPAMAQADGSFGGGWGQPGADEPGSLPTFDAARTIDPSGPAADHVPDVRYPQDPATVRQAAVVEASATQGGFGACGLISLPRDGDGLRQLPAVPDGDRVVLPALQDGDLLLRAVDAMGRTDTRYGDRGVLDVDLPPLIEPLSGARDVAVVAAPDGGVVVLASVADDDEDDEGDLFVLEVDGDGVAGTPEVLDPSVDDALIDAAATPDGVVVATRQPVADDDPTPTAVLVHLVDGALDPAYGTDGRADLAFNGPVGLEVGPGGEVYSRERAFGADIVRVTAAGVVDDTFGTDGVAPAPSGTPALDGAVDADGRLWMVTLLGQAVRVDRLAEDGSEDIVRTLDEPALADSYAGIAVDVDGTALVTHPLPEGEAIDLGFRTVGVTPAGQVDGDVGDDGALEWATSFSHIPHFPGPDEVLVTATDAEGRVLVQTGDDLRRIRPDGQLDGSCPIGEVGVLRVAGNDRFDTAAQLSESAFPTADTVVVATGVDFPDALAGGPAAAFRRAPLLLVTSDRVPDQTAEELERLAPDTILVLGGEAVVGTDVVAELENYGTVRRLAGDNRYETAAKVSAETFEPGVERAYVAVGTAFPDALAVGPAAGAREVPILLTASTTLPDATVAELDRLDPAQVVVVGGTGAISTTVENQLRSRFGNVERVAGADRYNTARQVMLFETQDEQDAIPPVDDPRAAQAHLATGTAFPDALAAGPVAAMEGAPLLLSRPDDLSEAARDALAIVAPQRVTVLGGAGALAGRVSDRLTVAELGHRFLGYADGEPLGWCSTIRWQFNPDGAPDGALDLLRTSIDRIEDASGLTFEYLGTTNEPLPGPGQGRSPVAADGSDAWASVLVGWGVPAQSVDVLGIARTVPVGPGYVSGSIVFQQGAGLPVDFSPESWGIVALHEFGHLAGLDHVPSPHVMYPSVGRFPLRDLTVADRLGMKRATQSPCDGWPERPSEAIG